MYALQIGSVTVDNDFDPMMLKAPATSYMHIRLEKLYTRDFPYDQIMRSELPKLGHILVDQSDLDCTDERAFPASYDYHDGPRYTAKQNLLANLHIIAGANPRAWLYVANSATSENRGWSTMQLATALADRTSPLYQPLVPMNSK